MQPYYLVLLGRITEEATGVVLKSVFCGGHAPTYEEAEGLARQKAVAGQREVVLPKIARANPNEVFSAIHDATEEFRGVVAAMNRGR